MTAEKGWQRLAKDIKTTLKYELGLVAIHSSDPSRKPLSQIQSDKGGFCDWRLPLFERTTSVEIPGIYPALFEFRVKLLTLAFLCRVIQVNLFQEKQAVLINNLALPGKRPVVFVPSLKLKP